MKTKTSGKPAISTAVAAAAVIVIVLVVGIGGYYFLGSPGTPSKTTASTTTTTSATTTTTSGSTSQPYTVQVGSSATTGRYLENGTGFTLYMFGADKPGAHSSACTGSCAAAWPPFYASSLNLPAGLDASNFSTITRSDGSRQTTYNGWPLYYYVGDAKAGDMFGEGLDQLGGLWYAIPPTLQQSGGQVVGGGSYTIGVAYKPMVGLYLTNGTGFTLYLLSKDTPNSGTTTCTSATCEKNWPAFYTSTVTVAPGLNSADFGTIAPYNGTKIVTYDGYALFYWVADGHPGDISGQGIGGFYVATAPTAVVPSATTTTTAATTTTTQTTYTSPYGY